MLDQELYSEMLDILAPFEVPTHGEILYAYCEPWRTYHNADHIMHMLRRSRQSDINLTDEARQRLELMILYHDVWYKLGRNAGENERRSAEWAVRDLSRSVSDNTVRLKRCVSQGINATATHSLDKINPAYVEEIATLLDLDLWGLGQDPEHFKEDTEKVWREYQPIATREEFDAGRSLWARNFLTSRNKIYHTEPFLPLEEMARYNLQQVAG